jgi:hypothetical protein
MLTGQLALIGAALFAGAAVVISVAQQPARLALDDRAALLEWQVSYNRAAIMQASLAVGLVAFYFFRDWRWLAGAVLVLANWPYTLIVISRTNERLHEIAPEKGDEVSRALIEHWGRLHAVRSVLGLAATVVFLWALN